MLSWARFNAYYGSPEHHRLTQMTTHDGSNQCCHRSAYTVRAMVQSDQVHTTDLELPADEVDETQSAVGNEVFQQALSTVDPALLQQLQSRPSPVTPESRTMILKRKEEPPVAFFLAILPDVNHFIYAKAASNKNVAQF